jgi:hypothetical protein
VTLAPGERLGWADATGPVLLHVEAGTVDLTARGSVSWVRAVADDRSSAGIEATMATGGGALVEAGDAAEIRAAPAVPAALLVVTLLPADDSTDDSTLIDASPRSTGDPAPS